MTREEAKEALSVLKIYDNQWLREAIDLAIEALTNVQNMHKGKWNDDVIEVVRCKDCRKRGSDDCPMFSREWRAIMRGNKCVDDFVFHDLTEPNGFCSYGKGDNNE